MGMSKTDHIPRGLYVSEKQINAIIGTPHLWQEDKSSGLRNSALEPRVESLRQLGEDIAGRKRESLRRGLTLRLDGLGRLFCLSMFDIDTLLICLLPELDLEYQRVYAYLQDDVTQKSPTVNLVLQLLCESFADVLKALGEMKRGHLPGSTSQLVKISLTGRDQQFFDTVDLQVFVVLEF